MDEGGQCKIHSPRIGTTRADRNFDMAQTLYMPRVYESHEEKIMHKVVQFSIFAALVAGSSLIHAAASKADMAFVQKAAQGGIAEVELSQLASSHSSSDSVKKFAADMVSAHTENNAKLKQIAEGEGISVPSETDSDHVALRNKLSMSKGAEFDRLYVEAMRKDHQAMLDLLNGSSDVADPKLKGFIADTKPVVSQHLKMATQLTGP